MVLIVRDKDKPALEAAISRILPSDEEFLEAVRRLYRENDWSPNEAADALVKGACDALLLRHEHIFARHQSPGYESGYAVRTREIYESKPDFSRAFFISKIIISRKKTIVKMRDMRRNCRSTLWSQPRLGEGIYQLLFTNYNWVYEAARI